MKTYNLDALSRNCELNLRFLDLAKEDSQYYEDWFNFEDDELNYEDWFNLNS